MEIYFLFNFYLFSHDSAKTAFASSYLKNSAYNWFKVYLINYLEYKSIVGKIFIIAIQDTQNIFANFKIRFVKVITFVYDDIEV